MDGWCGRVILVSALSQTKREQRERELANSYKKYSISRQSWTTLAAHERVKVSSSGQNVEVFGLIVSGNFYFQEKRILTQLYELASKIIHLY